MNNENTSSFGDYGGDVSRQRLVQLVMRGGAVVVLLILLWVAWLVVQSFHFRVVSTSPKSNNTSNISPFININFNRDLNEKSLSISSSPSIITSTKVKGKVLVVNLNAPSAPLDTNKTYTITIKSVSSTKGEKITNKVISFKPKVLDESKLPKDQANALNQRQRPPKDAQITLAGDEELINQGLTQDQVFEMQQQFQKFSPKATAVNINTDTVVGGPSADNIDGHFTYTFTVKVDGTPYSAQLDVHDDIVHLYLFKPNTTISVFDSGDVDMESQGD